MYDTISIQSNRCECESPVTQLTGEVSGLLEEATKRIFATTKESWDVGPGIRASSPRHSERVQQ